MFFHIDSPIRNVHPSVAGVSFTFRIDNIELSKVTIRDLQEGKSPISPFLRLLIYLSAIYCFEKGNDKLVITDFCKQAIVSHAITPNPLPEIYHIYQILDDTRRGLIQLSHFSFHKMHFFQIT